MTSPAIDGFSYKTLPGEASTPINLAVGGEGPAVVLLHGFPQTHYMWRSA